MVPRRLGFALAMMASFISASSTLAGDFDYGGGRQRPWHHGHHHHPLPPSYGGGYGLPTIVPGLGTFAGSITALRVRGVGTYFYVEGLGSSRTPMQPTPKAKIINVKAAKDPCSYENGVCVIRP
ncbi:hypothetical protein [Gellertiella hungarica]|uniref:Uncharacterized protein n=1 Tax=Gellertiella hungarica TaxID=1572859 RepID=A0A7W6J5L8_9HYPH|nr:hypothetical protein [Gellertiella hungarica]MBB4065231.1 hypothetical protein [Gellertiella hungarica]